MSVLPDFLLMSLKNVGRGRVRSLLTVLSIVIGITSVLLLTAIGESGKNMITAELTGVGIDGIMVFSDDNTGLSVADGERIRNRITGVTAVMPFETAIGYYTVRSVSNQSAVLIGVDPTATDYMSMDIRYGRMFSENECNIGKAVCVVGSDFARDAYKRENVVGRTIELTINGRDTIFTIVGVANSALNELSSLLGVRLPPFLYLPYTVVGDAENLQQIAIQVNGDTDPEATAAQIRTLLRKTNANGAHFLIENMGGYVAVFSSVIDIVTVVLAATAAISLLVAGIGIINSMLATVSDRKSEIGIMKAIGASAAQIAVIFLSEALVLTLIGCLLGVATAGLIIGGMGLYFGIKIRITAAGILIPIAVSVAVGLFSGILPAISAARLQPINAIRSD